MSLIRPGMKRPPPGFDVVEAALKAYQDEMKLATQEDSRGVVGITTRRRDDAQPSSGRGASGPKRHRGADANDDNDRMRVKAAVVDREKSEGEAKVDDDIDAGHQASPAEATDSNDIADADDVDQKPLPPLWRMSQINRDRTRCVFDALHRHRTISKEVFDYCVEMQLIDGGLARRWRIPGYERLCCTACGIPGSAAVAANTATKYALRDKAERRTSASTTKKKGDAMTTCVCRVPSSQRKDSRFVACAVCGCHGCCSADVDATRKAEQRVDADGLSTQ